MARNDENDWSGKDKGNDPVILKVVAETKQHGNRDFEKEDAIPIGKGWLHLVWLKGQAGDHNLHFVYEQQGELSYYRDVRTALNDHVRSSIGSTGTNESWPMLMAVPISLMMIVIFISMLAFTNQSDKMASALLSITSATIGVAHMLLERSSDKRVN